MKLVLFVFVLFSGVVLGRRCGYLSGCNSTQKCCNPRAPNANCYPTSQQCPPTIKCTELEGCGNRRTCCNPGCTNSYCRRGTTCPASSPSNSCIACLKSSDCGANAVCCNPGCYNSQCVYNTTGPVPCPLATPENCPLQCGNSVCNRNQICCAKGYVNQHCLGAGLFCGIVTCTNATSGLGACPPATNPDIGSKCCNAGCYDSVCQPAAIACTLHPGSPTACPVPCGNITCPFGETCCVPRCANRHCSKNSICSALCEGN